MPPLAAFLTPSVYFRPGRTSCSVHLPTELCTISMDKPLPERNCLQILALAGLTASYRQRNNSTLLCRIATSQASTDFRSE